LKLECDELLSNFAFNFKLRRCKLVVSAGDGVTKKTYTITIERFGPGVYGEAGRCRLTLSDPR